MLKRDSFILGVGIGIAGPAILFGIMFLTRLILGHVGLEKAAFVCVALNIIPIRYYFISTRFENTARGLLFITVVLILVVTLVNFGVIQKLLH
jgi:hypothetical protein